MKNLENFGVQELNANEKEITNGGNNLADIIAIMWDATPENGFSTWVNTGNDSFIGAGAGPDSWMVGAIWW